MAEKPKGGRGIKAPYETTHVRVPVPIKAEVEAMVENYKKGVIIDEEIMTNSTYEEREKAIELAREILISKKSARVSL